MAFQSGVPLFRNRLGAWCLTGQSNLNNIIDESPAHSGNYVLENDEKDLLEDLGLNYMIACTRGQSTPTTNGEVALNNSPPSKIVFWAEQTLRSSASDQNAGR